MRPLISAVEPYWVTGQLFQLVFFFLNNRPLRYLPKNVLFSCFNIGITLAIGFCYM